MKWIPINDRRKPVEHHWYVVYLVDKGWDTAVFLDGDFRNPVTNYTKLDVSHWFKPIPPRENQIVKEMLTDSLVENGDAK